ncbi:hypothetical protein HGO38_01395 [Rhizobium sp. CG5]|uniref:hypothetical protein n=1 Tax=Rhizobium sp. CG5 TaxID=2726076 RepID=UPI0020346CE6|nr:hypothetical protein [Rhizobium sp. CG5]MCM2472130.1 hypothetical protein [Rhizobium sp. CG5]
MAFEMIVPTPKAKPGQFKVSTVSRQGGAWRIQITIPSAEFGVAFGAAEQFDILRGTGDDAGKLMIRPNEAGLFKATGLKHCVIFRLPADDTTPQIEFKGEDPGRKVVDGCMLIELPAWAWEPGRWQQIRDARNTAQRQDAAEKLTRKDAMARIGAIKAP